MHVDDVCFRARIYEATDENKVRVSTLFSSVTLTSCAQTHPEKKEHQHR